MNPELDQTVSKNQAFSTSLEQQNQTSLQQQVLNGLGFFSTIEQKKNNIKMRIQKCLSNSVNSCHI